MVEVLEGKIGVLLTFDRPWRFLDIKLSYIYILFQLRGHNKCPQGFSLYCSFLIHLNLIDFKQQYKQFPIVGLSKHLT